MDQDGVTLSGLDIDGSLHSSVSGLTVLDTRIRCTGEQSWCVSLGSASTVRDSEIGGGRDGHTFGPAIGLLSGRYNGTIAPNAIARVNIHHTLHGMRVDGDTTVQDSYIHDLPMGDAPFQDAHTDAIMSTAGGNNVIRHNTLQGGNNCEVFVQWQEGNEPIGAYEVQDNQFLAVTRNGQQPTFGVCMEDRGIKGPLSVIDNTFSRGWQVGPIESPPGTVVSANKYSDGAPLPATHAS